MFATVEMRTEDEGLKESPILIEEGSYLALVYKEVVISFH